MAWQGIEAPKQTIEFPAALSFFSSNKWIKLIPKTIGNRKKDCAGGCARGINTTWENLQIEKHKSVQWAERTPSWLFCAFRFADFLRWCLSPERNLTHNLFFFFQQFLVLISFCSGGLRCVPHWKIQHGGRPATPRCDPRPAVTDCMHRDRAEAQRSVHATDLMRSDSCKLFLALCRSSCCGVGHGVVEKPPFSGGVLS